MWGLPSSRQLHASGQRQGTSHLDRPVRGAAEQVPQAATDLVGARVADRLETLTPQKTAEHLLASGRPHEPAWTEIGSLLFAWGCGYPRTRT